MDRQFRDLGRADARVAMQQCHVPNNPDKMSRLVLLSRRPMPRAEIGPPIKAVRETACRWMRLPRRHEPLAPDRKKWLLESAEAFRAIVQAAQDWEKGAASRPHPSRPRPSLSHQPSQGDDMNLSNSESRLNRRTLLRGAARGFLCRARGLAQQASGDRWRLLVNEAVTADLSISMLAMRYRGWADYMGAQIHNKQVLVDPIIDIQRFLQQAQSDQKPLLVFGKSVNQLSKLVRDHGYQPWCAAPSRTRLPSSCPRTRRSRTSRSSAAASCCLPDTFSATAAVARAEIRRQASASPTCRTRASRTAWPGRSRRAWRKPAS
jgi:hypothetical protein